MANYQDCYVAFMDLLGFKNLINNSCCDDILNIFTHITSTLNELLDGDKNASDIIDTDVKVKIMSDSICVYISSEYDNALTVLIQICTIFQAKMLAMDKPVLVRGGIARGDIYSNGDIIFGKGLTAAYMLESNNAKYPRIIIANDTINKYKSSYIPNCKYAPTVDDLYKYYLIKDNDLFYTLNYITMYKSAMCENGDCSHINNHIQTILDTTLDNSIREKYLYLYNMLN